MVGEADETVVEAFNAAVNGRDLEALAALMDDDHRFVDSAGQTVAGKAACVDAWRGFFAAFPDYRNVFADVRAVGDGVVEVRGRSVCSVAELTGPARWRAVVRDGLVVEWRVSDEASYEGEPVFVATSVDDWRAWLAANGESARAVWLILYRYGGPPMGELVEQALCYGWIDSKAVKRDAESRYQRFSPRNPKSTWSRLNRQRVARLTEEGLMAPSGQAMVDLARQTGTWDLLADAQDLIVPDDLRRRLDQDEVARANFDAFPPSSRRMILEWIATAKRPETRARRIDETVDLARQNIRAHQPRRPR